MSPIPAARRKGHCGIVRARRRGDGIPPRIPLNMPNAARVVGAGTMYVTVSTGREATTGSSRVEKHLAELATDSSPRRIQPKLEAGVIRNC